MPDTERGPATDHPTEPSVRLDLPTKLDVQVELDPRINFAMQQNDVSVIQAIRIENSGDVPLRDLEVRISSEPAFAEPWSTRIAEVRAASAYTLSAVDLRLSAGYLASLTERVRGNLKLEVFVHAAEAPRSLLTRNEPVVLLAPDEWGGLSSLPEILTAFVLPNHPANNGLLSSAAKLMEGWTGDPSLSGYQSKDPARTYQMAAAAYGAIRQLGLTYINPPASFEEEGQRVRLPGRILETGMATCLDVALLAAGCLEQMGLNSLVVIVQGHAFAGVWLHDECFPEPATDDVLRLKKRVDLHEIVVFDPTCATTRPSPDFNHAVSEAKRWLHDPERFYCTIDVRRSRKGRIRPLPEGAASPADPADDAPARALTVGAPELPQMQPTSNGSQGSQGGGETASSRLDRWGRKLLDLSLRNRLLNFKETKSTIPLLCPDLSRLEDMLADGTSFQIHPRPAEMSRPDPRDHDAHLRRTGEGPITALLGEELEAKRLHADTATAELERRLVGIYRAGKLGMEEGGASGLYLAVGYLAWYESETSEQRRLAPLLLIPLELHRKSARQGFTLQQGDDEPRINVTLLELLKQDHGLVIPGLDPLPEDESGVDVPRILRTVRQAVRDIDRWEVVEDVCIGIFSFTKFLMWRDLTSRTDELIKNPVVDHLVNRPHQPYETEGATIPRAEVLDDEYAPIDTFCPLPADSSQLAAVFAAASGTSFVLEGPPGTGKSQTITNLIAHCLTEGKTILFVSEKMAALDVVYRRLAQNGLGRYCLELHSNKSHKGQVLAQLEDGLRRYESGSSEEWEREARKLGDLRLGLNAYAQALHRRKSTGDTAFRAISRLIGLRDVPRVRLQWDDPESLTAEDLDKLRDLVASLAIAASACGEIGTHPWKSVRVGNWTPGWQDKVEVGVDALSDATELLSEQVGSVSEQLGLGDSGWSFQDLEVIGELAAVLLASPPPAPTLLLDPDWEEVRARIDDWIKHGRIRDDVRAELRKGFREEIADLDHDALDRQLGDAERAWWPISWWRRRPVARALARVSVTGKAPPREQFAALIAKARLLKREQQRLDAASDSARHLLGRYWKDGEAEWEEIAQVSKWSGKLRSLALRLASDDLDRAAKLRERWSRLTSEGAQLLARDGTIGRRLTTLREASETFQLARQHLVELTMLDVEHEWMSPSADNALGRVRESVRQWQTAQNRLHYWCVWQRVKEEAVGSGLGPLVEAQATGAFTSQDLPNVFERSFTEWWLAEAIEREPALNEFFSPEHEHRIAQFREVDERYLELTRFMISAKLDEKVPTSTAVLPNSEMGILKKEIGKKRRQMPMRQLFQKIPNLLPRLKPCLLMSPMSVAQYLDSSYPSFDLVVFDEASQIPVWDAIGAIGRGRQAIVVGDPKQLPPTNFFQRAEDDEEDIADDVVEDLESILDDCIGAQLPWLPLDWHYRSRHESLITFSNHHYYKNRLLTFPSPEREGMGVSWHHVEGGTYDKGKTRTNRKEADAVVAEVLRRLHDPVQSVYTIGIVTFSQAQQTLIEDLLDAARMKHPEIEPHFAEDALEPVFVKNLENVQGDERDVILFSICYGPDAFGKVSMNFGPMNREGGERRLNVAITRARREVKVFSTLRADHIDLSRTRARGVSDLKQFLSYAERGPSALIEAVEADPEADFDSPFEEAVYDALVQRGWRVDKQVGSARYRIDLAVVDPEAPGRYLLGVECDGANYHRAKVARDRDKLREGVLRDLGWELHRVWSTDWWTNPQREIEKLETALTAVMERRKNGHAQPKPTAPARVASAPRLVQPLATEVTVDAPAAGHPIYEHVELPIPANARVGLYDQGASREIAKQIVQIVSGEGPVSLDSATRRIAATWGLDRVSSRVLDRVRKLVPAEHVYLQASDAGDFLWPVDSSPEDYRDFRVPDGDGKGARQAAELPLEEIDNAAHHILASHFSAPMDELVRETAKLFGFQRLGRIVDERMRMGIELLIERKAIRLDGESVVLEG